MSPGVTATTLIIDDDPAYARSLVRLVKREGFSAEVAYSGEEALERVAELRPDLAIVDLALPGMDGVEVLKRLRGEEPDCVCIAVSGTATVESAVAAMHAGAFDFLTKTSELEEISFKLRKALEVAELRRKVQFFVDRERRQHAGRMVGESPTMKEVYARVQEIAATPDTTVLILGETGTGKDLVARAIHDLSERKEKPMVSVNCTAVPGNLLESEFFGHEKGAFTSALRTKQGLVELAHGGTLFLDEIGDLDLSLQGKLLRLIEERRFKRVGGVTDMEADVRFIAATNRALEVMVEEGRFREDLLYRLNVFPIELPPLRGRGEDVLLLAQHFIHQLNQQMGKNVEGLASEAKAALLAYTFPGNVRQLRNMLEQAMILERGKWITVDRFPGIKPARARRSQEIKGLPLDRQLAEVRVREEELWRLEREIIEQALTDSKGNKTNAAQILGISRFALQRRLKRMKQGTA